MTDSPSKMTEPFTDDAPVPTVLNLRSLRKSYGNLNVLDGIDINIEKNEIAAIVGKSGSGKSTLLHILGTLDNADSGSIIIGSEIVASKSANNHAVLDQSLPMVRTVDSGPLHPEQSKLVTHVPS